MHILMVTRRAHLGTGNYFGTLMKGLVSRGHTCDVMLRSGRALRHICQFAQHRYGISHNLDKTYNDTISIIKHRKPDVAHVVLTEATLPVIKACLAAQIPVVASIVNKTKLDSYLETIKQISAILVLNKSNYDHYCLQYPQITSHMHLGTKIIDRNVFAPVSRHQDANYTITSIGRLSASKGKLALQNMDAVWRLHNEFPQLKLNIVGTGTRLLAVKCKALQRNLQAMRKIYSAPGGTSKPQKVMQESGIVLAAGFSAAEALSCHCKVIGLGFYGLFGLVTAENIDDAIAANFGDTDSSCPNPSVDDITRAINEAINSPDDIDWIEQAFAGVLNSDYALTQFENLLIFAAQNYRLN